MNTTEFALWLSGYLEALETEGIESIKIKTIRDKIGEIKNSSNQERVVFGPSVTGTNTNHKGYNHPDTGRPIV